MSLILKNKFPNTGKPEGKEQKEKNYSSRKGEQKAQRIQEDWESKHTFKRHILGYINSSLSMGWEKVKGNTSFQNRTSGICMGEETKKSFGKMILNTRKNRTQVKS